MKTTAPCSFCHTVTEVAPARFITVTSLLLISLTRTYAGNFCEHCGHSIANRALIHNLLLGWWSPRALLIRTPLALIQNSRNKARLDQQLHGLRSYASPQTDSFPEAVTPAESVDPNPDALQRLPWFHLLDLNRRSAPVGRRSLTPPTAVIALAALALVISLIAVVTLSLTNGNNTPQEAAYLRSIGWLVLVCSVAAITGSLFWQKFVYDRTDRAIDLLSAIFPHGCIFELDRAFITALALEIGSKLRLAIVVQNRYDKATHLVLDIDTFNTTYPLQSPLRPSEAVLFYAELPLSGPGVTNVTISGTALGDSGFRSLFAQREFLSSATRDALTAGAQALGGQLSVSSPPAAGHLAVMDHLGKLALAVSHTIRAQPLPPVWRRIVLWMPHDLHPPSYAASLIADLLQKPTTVAPPPL